MRRRSLATFFLAAASLFALLPLCGTEAGTISGVVRAADGAPIEGAQIVVASVQAPSNTLRTQSGKEGEYEITGVPPGAYTVAAGGGYLSSPSQHVMILPGETPVHVDFQLTRESAKSASDHVAATRPPPKFEAAGVRGLIDAGGYSAAAGGAAASGMIKGMADIRRADEDPSASVAKQWPCSLEPELRKSFESHQANADANRKLGQYYLAHEQPARAIPFLERASSESGNDYRASKDLALAWIQNGQFDSAGELLDSLAQSHDDAEIHNLLARADEGSGKFKQASQQYSVAAKEAPSEENLFGAGYELILAGLPADAAREFEAGLRRYPTSIRLLVGAGAAEFLQGKTLEGTLEFLRATDLVPSDPRPYAFLASASVIDTAESKRVRESFKRYLDLAPNDAAANYDYAFSLWNDRGADAARADMEKIEALLQRAIQIKSDFTKAHFLLANVYFERQEYEPAIQEYQATLRLDPDLNEVHYRLAKVYQRVGQPALATAELRVFEQVRETRSAEAAGAGINIEQLVSVINPPENLTTATPVCPDAAP